MEIQQIIPVLPSADFDRTTRFYELLGFREQGIYPDYLILNRAGQEIHFFLEDGDHTYGHGHSHFGCYLRAVGLVELYKALKADGVSLDPPAAKPWGLTELLVTDPDGSLLRFGELVEG